MSEIHFAIETCLKEVEKARNNLKKDNSVQVRSLDERDLLKATALAWFNNHRTKIIAAVSETTCSGIDTSYRKILELSDKQASRKKYDLLLKELRKEISSLRSSNITKIASPQVLTSDISPNFSNLVSDVEMQKILTDRWDECNKCLKANAPLATIVMTGGLLETLLLARINKESNKSKIFTSNAAPKDSKTNQTLPLKEWVLKNYIEVAHEMGWISQTEKDLGVVLRDYRNYIHPFKQRSHGIKLEFKDAMLIWELSKSISKQIISS